MQFTRTSQMDSARNMLVLSSSMVLHGQRHDLKTDIDLSKYTTHAEIEEQSSVAFTQMEKTLTYALKLAGIEWYGQPLD
jgi:hypothetical protein